jgi:hypothetical protein
MPLDLQSKRWYPYVFLLAFVLVIAVWWRFRAGLRPELLLTTVGGIAGLAYFTYRQHVDETKLFGCPRFVF